MGPRDTWDSMASWLRGLGESLPEKPRALLVVSAHWEAARPTVQAHAAPPLLYDYYGFPEHTYSLTWPAPGAPELAARVRSLLEGAGIEADEDAERGFDHGVFVPLKLTFPDAEIPTLQLSLQRGLDPAFHLRMGEALAPLRDEGVLILGSGMSYHNMQHLRGNTAQVASAEFDGWLRETIGQPPEERHERLVGWSQAPAARVAHPREEHLLPLMVAAGAAGSDAGTIVFRDRVMTATVSAARFG